ncbi:MAG: SDR family NAD(P)-dependent oxidoreductase, partial [Leeuwenhoekiella sp.]|nr:SDR family NAD(P)-dependent oxidoreductase [Leeuwenhoekiella sp.]
MSNKTALITGATSGIGAATARIFATNNINLVLCGRRQDRLEALQKELSKHVKVHTLSFDVRDKEIVQESINGLPIDFQQIDILINNAGNAHGLDTLQDGNT